ncbi:MAG: SUMF1/EgtB/PvdO family nonheme iron enzyme [Saprospiraceae bacterium]
MLYDRQGPPVATDKWDTDLASLFADLEKHGFQPRPGPALDPLAEYLLPADVPDPSDHHEAPYLGLRYFDRTAARLFFGRTRELLELFSLVENPEVRLISLFGHSGVGKSSFLAAGAVPRLEGVRAPHYARRDKTAARGLATQLDDLRDRPKQPDKPPVYILDQAEEMCADRLPGEQEAFVQCLHAALHEEPAATVVLGFRSDYHLDLSDLLARVAFRQEALPLRPLGPDASGDCPALLDYLRRCEPALFISLEHRYFPAMIHIQGGTFEMGDVLGDKEFLEKELPVHTVKLSNYHLGETPVTWQQYGLYCLAAKAKIPDGGGFGRGERPVVNVSWEDAAAYASWLTKHKKQPFRLPTEAEWEYAARERGKAVRFGNGKNVADPTEMNFDASERPKKPYSFVGEYRRKTTPFRQFPPNELGLYDMSGNVWEWCADWYGNYPKPEQQNPEGPETVQQNPKGPETGSGRVLRGGSWFNEPALVRGAYRSSDRPSSRTVTVGFRVAW